MFLGPTLVLYAMVGVAVAVALYVTEKTGPPAQRLFLMATALVFWPIYLPLLLTPRVTNPESEPPRPPAPDELSTAITQVEAELEGALQSLDGWAEDVLARERGRLRELRTAWKNQAERIREMDQLLSRPENAEPGLARSAAFNDRLRTSEEARRQNLERLKRVRERTYQDLIATLAWVRELVSMIHLAKFTGAPASRAEELVAQIAAAVEGVSAMTWQEEEWEELGTRV